MDGPRYLGRMDSSHCSWREIKELNILIMLARDTERLKALAKSEGYKEDELLPSHKVRAYIAQEGLYRRHDAQRRSRGQTLIPVVPDDYGMNFSSFDDTIEDIARIHDEIIWGDK